MSISFRSYHSFFIGVVLFSLASLLASCGDKAQNFQAPKVESGTLRSRALLSVGDQREFDKYYLEGLRQRLKGNGDAAYDLFQRALEIHPNASEALWSQAELILTGEIDDSTLVAKADSMLLKAYQLEPENFIIVRSLAKRWIAQRKSARAAHLYEQLVKDNPDPEDLEVLIYLHEDAKNYPAALAALDRFEAIEGKSEETGLTRFNLYNEMGDKHKAYLSISTLCEENPNDLRFRTRLGDLYLEHGYNELALAVYQDILTTDPHNPQASISMLNYYLKNDSIETFHRKFSEVLKSSAMSFDDKEKALQRFGNAAMNGDIDKLRMFEHFREVLLQPQITSTIGRMAQFYVYMAKLPLDSLELPRRAILSAEPENEEMRLHVLSYALKKQVPQEVLTLCEEGISLHPQQAVFHFYSAVSNFQLNQLDATMRRLNSAIAIENDSSSKELYSDIYAMKGDLFYQLGKKKQAFEAFDLAIDRNPENAGCLNNYAYFLSLQRLNMKKAATMSEKAVKLEPENPTYLDTYAWVLFEMKNYAQAKTYIDQTIALIEEGGMPSTTDDTLYDHAGDIYFRCGNVKKAMSFWKTAFELTNNEDLSKKLQRKIKNKRL